MAEHSTEVFPRPPHNSSNKNDISDHSLPEGVPYSSSRPPEPSRLVYARESVWPHDGHGVRLRVAFIDDPPPSHTFQQTIVGIMNQWSEHCNVHFTLLPSEPSNDHIFAAEVRITFSGLVSGKLVGGRWSYVGTEILQITNPREPTMMLEGLNANGVTQDLTRTVLHETGHTLGFVHEHFRDDILRLIDTKKAYAYYWKHNQWDENKVNREVLQPLSKHRGGCKGSEIADRHSIMCYPIPRDILRDDADLHNIPGGTVLSDSDKDFAKSLYPIPEVQHQEIVDDKDIVKMAAWKQDLYLLMKDGEVQLRSFKEAGRLAEKCTIGRVSDAENVTTLKACDGQLYMIKNNNAVLTWDGSFIRGRDSTNWTRLEVEHRDSFSEQQIDIRGSAKYVHDPVNGRIVMQMLRERAEDSTNRWRELNNSSSTVRISSTKTHLYRLNNRGEIQHLPVPNGKPKGWDRIDNCPDSKSQIATNWRHLYQQRGDGDIWIYTKVSLNWAKVYKKDKQDSTRYRIEASEDRLFRIEEPRSDGGGRKVWVNDDNTEKGWKLLELQENWTSFVYTGGYVYDFVEATGKATRHTGIC
ncbi:hypothetical protein PM082_011853 [Marasmius tenuissimus]|nr:hypothetical protein PM082_011853 [Marasmius tenuissimus]